MFALPFSLLPMAPILRFLHSPRHVVRIVAWTLLGSPLLHALPVPSAIGHRVGGRVDSRPQSVQVKVVVLHMEYRLMRLLIKEFRLWDYEGSWLIYTMERRRTDVQLSSECLKVYNWRWLHSCGACEARVGITYVVSLKGTAKILSRPSGDLSITGAAAIA